MSSSRTSIALGKFETMLSGILKTFYLKHGVSYPGTSTLVFNASAELCTVSLFVPVDECIMDRLALAHSPTSETNRELFGGD